MKPSHQTFAAALSAALVVSSSPAAHAVPSQHQFTLRWTSGELAGHTSVGSFFFESTRAVPNAYWQAESLLSSLNLTLRGQAFDTTNANANYLAFDASGRLSGIVIGTSCNWTTCSVNSDERNSWSVLWQVLGGQVSSQAVAADGLGQFSRGSVALSAVPEPSPGHLTALGVLVLALLSRKQL